MSRRQPSAELALRTDDGVGTDLSGPSQTADHLAAAFLAAYGPATRTAYARDLRHFSRFLMRLGSIDPLHVRRVHIDAYAREQEGQGAAPATIARRLSALAGFFEYAVAEGLIAQSPMTRIRRPRVSTESARAGVGRSEIRALLTAAEASGERDHALVALLCLSGVRISEALSLDVTDLGHERGHTTMRVVRKGGKVQTLAVAPRAAEALTQLIGCREVGPVFTTRTGTRMDRFGARKVVARLSRAAGIDSRVSPHRLRHSWVTLALDAGVPLHVVQDGAGHADPKTTQRYNARRHSLDGAAAYAVAAHVA